MPVHLAGWGRRVCGAAREDFYCHRTGGRPARQYQPPRDRSPAVVRSKRRTANGDRSFHAAATWNFSEGERRLRRVRYKEPPEGISQ